MRSVRMPARTLAALTGAALAVVAASSTAPAAPVEPTTTCVGALSGVHVGQLEVPPGTRCELELVYVRGDARVGSGAVLSMRRSEIGGRTVVAGGALEASSATFHDLVLDDAETAYLTRATVRGSVSAAVGTFSLTSVTVTGDLDARGGARAPETGQVLDVDGATVQGSLTSDGLEFSVDDLTVHGDALVTDAGPAPRSSLAAGTVVSRDLVCTGNTGARGVQTAAVLVIGERVGQCA